MMQESDFLERYKIIKRIGAGGMGEIFLGEQISSEFLRRKVILKTVLREHMDNPNSLDEFFEEARVLAALNHPNVVSIYDITQWGDNPIIVMEYIDGVNLSLVLRMALAKEESIPTPLSTHIIREAAQGLAFAHAAKDTDGQALNLVHRDISPGNIMLRSDGIAKILDFGIAKAEDRATMTSSGNIKGKLNYMSPEQLNEEDLDHRTDQFALGIVFWQLCTQAPMFKGCRNDEIVRRISFGEIDTPSKVNPGVPKELEAIIMKMLSLKPDERYEDCSALADALKVYLDKAHPGTSAKDVAEFITPMIEQERREAEDSMDEAAQKLAAFSQSLSTNHGTRRLKKRKRIIAGMALSLVVMIGLVVVLIAGEKKEFNSVKAPVSGTKKLALESLLPPKGVEPVDTRSAQRQIVSKPILRNPEIKAVSGQGLLTVNTKPWSQLWVDGKLQGVTPLYQVKLKAGERTLVFKNTKLGLEVRKKVNLKPGQESKLFFKLKD